MLDLEFNRMGGIGYAFQQAEKDQKVKKDMAMQRLEPVPYGYYDMEKDEQYYRVPVFKTNNQFDVSVGTHLFRHFTYDTLPDEIKQKVALIEASGVEIKEPEDWHLNPVKGYSLDHSNKEFRKIGWKVSEGQYCVILSNKFLLTLRGDM
jgi:hypothetical protein